MENFNKAQDVTLDKPPVAAVHQELNAKPGERNTSNLYATQDTSSSHLPTLLLEDKDIHFDKAPVPGSTTHATVQVGNESRDMYLHIPSNYDASKPSPLIVTLNGMGEGAKGMENFTQLSAAGEKDGYMVAYLDGKGTQHAWNNGERFGGNANDAGFVNTVIDHLKADTNIDSNKVYMAGFSQGASGMDAIVSQTGGRVAAVADVEGWTSGKEQPLTTPVSALIIHGKENEWTPAEGSDWQFVKGIGHAFSRSAGAGLTEAGVGLVSPHMESTQHTADYFAKADGATQVSTRDNGEMHITDYKGGKNGTEVEMILADHRRNGWAGSPYPNPAMRDANGQPVTDQDLVINFFNNHPKH